MIKTLIFDFGDVFINLDKEGAMKNAMDLFQIETFEADMIKTNMSYETGNISTEAFINYYRSKFTFLTQEDIVSAWNYILKDFPRYRLNFIQDLASEKRLNLILLSNTNEMHIDYIKRHISFYNAFKNCFDKFYLSHEIRLRKPNTDTFEFVLSENNLNPEECLFIDDTAENTRTAETLGLHTWTIDETKEDVINLFSKHKNLF